VQVLFLWLGLHPCETETSLTIISSPARIAPFWLQIPSPGFEELPPAGLLKMHRPESGSLILVVHENPRLDPCGATLGATPSRRCTGTTAE
jgi:hypothetical protein